MEAKNYKRLFSRRFGEVVIVPARDFVWYHDTSVDAATMQMFYLSSERLGLDFKLQYVPELLITTLNPNCCT